MKNRPRLSDDTVIHRRHVYLADSFYYLATASDPMYLRESARIRCTRVRFENEAGEKEGKKSERIKLFSSPRKQLSTLKLRYYVIRNFEVSLRQSKPHKSQRKYLTGKVRLKLKYFLEAFSKYFTSVNILCF